MNAHTLPANARRTQWDRLEGLDTPRYRPAAPPTQKGRGAGQDVTAGSAPRHSINSYRDTRCDDSRIGTSDQPIRVPHQALKKAPGAGPTPCGTLGSAAHAHRDSQ